LRVCLSNCDFVKEKLLFWLIALYLWLLDYYMSLNNLFYLIYLISIAIVYYAFSTNKKYFLLYITLVLVIVVSYIFTYTGFTIDCPEGYYCGSVSFGNFLFLNVLPTSFLLNYTVIKIQEKKLLDFVGLSLSSLFGIIFVYLAYGTLFDLIFIRFFTFTEFYIFASPFIFLLSLTIVIFLPTKVLISHYKSLKDKKIQAG
jgi:hypothetical protein